MYEEMEEVWKVIEEFLLEQSMVIAFDTESRIEFIDVSGIKPETFTVEYTRFERIDSLIFVWTESPYDKKKIFDGVESPNYENLAQENDGFLDIQPMEVEIEVVKLENERNDTRKDAVCEDDFITADVPSDVYFLDEIEIDVSDDNGENNENMKVDEFNLDDELGSALSTADAFGKASKIAMPETDSLTDYLKDHGDDDSEEEWMIDGEIWTGIFARINGLSRSLMKGLAYAVASDEMRFGNLAANLDNRWPVRRLEHVAGVIVEALKEKKAANNVSSCGMTRQEARDAAHLHIGDTSLIDHVLKVMNNVIIGNCIIRRAVNRSTKVLEYPLLDFKGGKEVCPPKVQELIQELTICPERSIYSDVAYLCEHVLLGYPESSDTVDFTVQKILHSKHFVKEWPFRDEDELTCQVGISWLSPNESHLRGACWKYAFHAYLLFVALVLRIVITGGTRVYAFCLRGIAKGVCFIAKVFFPFQYAHSDKRYSTYSVAFATSLQVL